MTINPIAAATTGSTGSTTPTAAQNATNAEALFLKMLTTELQSQDPTSPMDPTQMVGQMFSMNQLNELIAINQTLQNAFGTGAPTSASGAASAANAVTGAH